MPAMAVSNRRDESPPIGYSNIVAEREPRWVFRVNIVWLGGSFSSKKAKYTCGASGFHKDTLLHFNLFKG